MRTTVELPVELLRAAKSEAAARGESLKDFLARAVTHELSTVPSAGHHTRVRLPLVASTKPGTVDLTNAGIEAVFAAEDAEKHASR